MNSVGEKLAWAAGLFEGEGSFSGKPGGQCRARLSMCDRDVVQRFADIMDVGNIGIKPQDRPNRKTQWQWRVGARRDVKYVIELLLPYLGERRTTRALEVLAIVEDQLAGAWKPTHCAHGHPLDGRRGNGGRYCLTCNRVRAARRDPHERNARRRELYASKK